MYPHPTNTVALIWKIGISKANGRIYLSVGGFGSLYPRDFEGKMSWGKRYDFSESIWDMAKRMFF